MRNAVAGSKPRIIHLRRAGALPGRHTEELAVRPPVGYEPRKAFGIGQNAARLPIEKDGALLIAADDEVEGQKIGMTERLREHLVERKKFVEVALQKGRQQILPPLFQGGKTRFKGKADRRRTPPIFILHRPKRIYGSRELAHGGPLQIFALNVLQKEKGVPSPFGARPKSGRIALCGREKGAVDLRLMVLCPLQNEVRLPAQRAITKLRSARRGGLVFAEKDIPHILIDAAVLLAAARKKAGLAL